MKNNLMTHVVAGYPSMRECEEVVLAMAEMGVAFIEIQIPFSDPIADGPTIMQANERALLNGVTTEDCFRLIQRLKKKTETPLLVMTYFNIPFRYGLERFCKKAGEYGVYGLIIPDMQIDEEEYENYLGNCKKYQLHAIQVISPITSGKRLKKVAAVSSGFVYCVSAFGTTGERKRLNLNINSYMARVKRYIKTPIALGFGISDRNQVMTALKCADIVVVGSKIINILRSSKGSKAIAIKNFLKEIL